MSEPSRAAIEAAMSFFAHGDGMSPSGLAQALDAFASSSRASAAERMRERYAQECDDLSNVGPAEYALAFAHAAAAIRSIPPEDGEGKEKDASA